MNTLLRVAVAALFIAMPFAAHAQGAPSYAQPAASYPGEENIHGRVINFDGGYNVQVRDERGFIDNVRLHPGTIINPTGLTLAPGMIVNILGYNAGADFAANEIDTPYVYYGGVPYYGGYPWWHYGPSVNLGFYFGHAGWWHGGYFQSSSYGWRGGVRIYTGIHINSVYRGGSFRGSAYVAPREHGGYYGSHLSAEAQYRGGSSNYRGGGANFHGGDSSHHSHHH
jgi:hypothetical protein